MARWSVGQDLRRRNPLPEGTVAVGIGLAVTGLAAYAYLVISARVLGPAEYGGLSVLWALVFLVGGGFFLPLEQEVGRAVADRRARDIGSGPVVKKAAIASIFLTAGLIVVTLLGAAFFPLVENLFHGQTVLLVCFVIALITYAVQFLCKGTLAGNGRFGPYGVILGAEGIVRVLPLIVLVAAGIDNLTLYGLALAIPPIVAVLIAMRGQHGLMPPGPDAQWSELSTNLTLLFLGSLAAQALSYAAALGGILLAKGPAQRALVADFLVGFFIARIPILLFQAVQAALLPKLAALASIGRLDDFRSGLRKLVIIVVGVGAFGILCGVTIGPEVGKILFGDKFHLDRLDLGLLFTGSALFIFALTLAQALIALRGHGRALVAWAVGLSVAIVVTVVGNQDMFFLRASELGFLAGCGAAALVMAILLATRMRTAGPESLTLLVEQIEHEPLEI